MPTKRDQFVQSVRARRLGERMRQLREERGLTLKYVAAYLAVEFSTLARYERAEWPFRRDYVIALLDVYGIHDEGERAELIGLAQSAWRLDHWAQTSGRYDDLLPATSEGLLPVDPLWVQAGAQRLCIYASTLVPAVAQTRDYAEAIARQTVADSRLVDQAVARFMEWQQQFDGKPPTSLAIVLEPQILRRPVGGRAVLAQQLEFLARLAQRKHVDLRVMPDQVGVHAGLDGAFTVCEPPAPYPPVALIGHLTGRLMVEAHRAARYGAVFTELTETALDPTHSIDLIHLAAEDLRSDQPTELAGRAAA